MSDEPTHIGTFWIGRVVCEACQALAMVVLSEGVEMVTCPTCGGVCVDAVGPDDLA